MSYRPVIALTMGDPAGIGPELAVRAAGDQAFSGRVRLLLYGIPSILEAARQRYAPGALLEIIPVESKINAVNLPAGKADPLCGLAAYHAVKMATLDALSGSVDAIVTAPMNKYSVNLAGITFSGHTEMIAELCLCRDFAMMQSSGSLRMIFVTTHIPIAEVSGAVTMERIELCTRLLHDVIRQEGIASPKIAVMALNPHAGENGCMGHEEIERIIPVIEKLRGEGMDLYGPVVPDVMFIGRFREKFDGIVSMYHDQGHIPFKMLAFESGVNSTPGLPIIRTSPDHGSAFDIAWKQPADTGSFFAALDLAIKRAEKK